MGGALPYAHRLQAGRIGLWQACQHFDAVLEAWASPPKRCSSGPEPNPNAAGTQGRHDNTVVPAFAGITQGRRHALSTSCLANYSRRALLLA